MKETINRIKKLFRKDYIVVSGSVIPSKHRRCCGPEFKDHSFYLKSAEAEATRLVTQFGCNRSSKVLDIGCGQGRLPIGILRVIGEIDYLGIDIVQQSVDWCNRHIGRAHPSFRFSHLNVYNERYHRDGIKLDGTFRFDVASESIDIVYLFSVFSHTTEEDMRIYLRDFRRVLRKTGKIFFTAFVEENVPSFSINPDGYIFENCRGPLHIVRYNKAYLFSILEELGYRVEAFTHGTEADRQSAIYLGRSESQKPAEAMARTSVGVSAQ